MWRARTSLGSLCRGLSNMLIYFLTFNGKREVQFNTDFSFRYYFGHVLDMWSIETLGM